MLETAQTSSVASGKKVDEGGRESARGGALVRSEERRRTRIKGLLGCDSKEETEGREKGAS